MLVLFYCILVRSYYKLSELEFSKDHYSSLFNYKRDIFTFSQKIKNGQFLHKYCTILTKNAQQTDAFSIFFFAKPHNVISFFAWSRVYVKIQKLLFLAKIRFPDLLNKIMAWNFNCIFSLNIVTIVTLASFAVSVPQLDRVWPNGSKPTHFEPIFAWNKDFQTFFTKWSPIYYSWNIFSSV